MKIRQIWNIDHFLFFLVLAIGFLTAAAATFVAFYLGVLDFGVDFFYFAYFIAGCFGEGG
jgi:hypothetical protein